jgi:hypothetical protein
VEARTTRSGCNRPFAIALILAGTFVLMRSTSRDKLAL